MNPFKQKEAWRKEWDRKVEAMKQKKIDYWAKRYEKKLIEGKSAYTEIWMLDRLGVDMDYQPSDMGNEPKLI